MTTMTMNNQTSQALVPTGGAPQGQRRAVFVLTEKMGPEGPRTFWTKVGVAFDNRDGSVTVRLDALPLSGTLQIRDEDTRRDRAASAPF